MKISFVRGAYMNNFEGQNYELPLTGYSSLFPLDDHVPFPLVKLPSLADMQRIPFLERAIKFIANRTCGDSQVLFGLEKCIYASDIVHVGDPHYYYSYQAAQMRAKGQIKRLICTWWETIPFNNESTSAKRKIKKYVMGLADMFICYTEQAKKCLLAEGVKSEIIKVVPLGVDLAVFGTKRKPDKEKFTILFVGRLVEEKGIMDVYSAFKQVHREYKNISLKIVGRGKLENALNTLIENDGLRNSVTIEHASYGEMPNIFQSADVLCVPSKKTVTWEEQFGMVFIEAMACGVPIISYDTGAIKSVVGEAGILLQENDITGIGMNIARMIKQKELGRKIGTIGRERAVALYDAKKTALRMDELYKSL